VSDSKLVGGVYAAIVTPFDANEKLDLGAFRAVLEYVVGCGVQGLVVAGTTGEGHALAAKEKKALWNAAVKHTRARCPVVAGTGATTTRQALELQRMATDCGCDALLPLTPWFEKPSPDAILAYYSDLADAAKLPILLYHNPSRTGLDWPAEHIAEVACKLAGKVVGVKDSTHKPERVRVLRENTPDDFLIFSGWPYARAEFEAAGANGAIDALATVLPAETVDAWNGIPEKLEYVRSVYRQLHKSRNYIALLKHMMNQMDLPAGRVRRPHDILSDEEKKSAPELRYRGGAAGQPPAWGYSSAEVQPLLAPGLLEECIAAPPVKGLEISSAFKASDDDYCYNHHAQITHFDGRFWVGWSAGWCNEDSPGQVVRVATSRDGKSWSQPEFVMSPPEGALRWTMGGFWEFDGKLHLLAGRTTRVRYVDGEVAPGVLWENQWCELFVLEGEAWKPLGKIFENFYPNESPRRLPGGGWICPGVTSRADVVAYVGQGTSPQGWEPVTIASRTDNYNPGGTKLTEPSWYSCGKKLRLLLRDDSGSGILFITESSDGKSWSPPQPTDFPDATSKFHCHNLTDGRVIMLSNPAPDLGRKLLSIAVSENGGKNFSSLHKLACDPAMRPRHKGMHKVNGYSYPSVIEHQNRLLIAYAPNKEDIEVLSLKTDLL
jgi:4-hydroxy-tetrahydrodipicolinate synthase